MHISNSSFAFARFVPILSRLKCALMARETPMRSQASTVICTPIADSRSQENQPPEGDCRRPTTLPSGLPTLQRNALRKIFGRHDFSPEEVVGLGLRRLQQAEGIGSKGLATIQNWLRSQGHELVLTPTAAPRRASSRQGNDLEHAIRLLRRNGYVVQRGE
jgi:hypothetical protein